MYAFCSRNPVFASPSENNAGGAVEAGAVDAGLCLWLCYSRGEEDHDEDDAEFVGVASSLKSINGGRTCYG